MGFPTMLRGFAECLQGYLKYKTLFGRYATFTYAECRSGAWTLTRNLVLETRKPLNSESLISSGSTIPQALIAVDPASNWSKLLNTVPRPDCCKLPGSEQF
jgi:hypothetical protein